MMTIDGAKANELKEVLLDVWRAVARRRNAQKLVKDSQSDVDNAKKALDEAQIAAAKARIEFSRCMKDEQVAREVSGLTFISILDPDLSEALEETDT